MIGAVTYKYNVNRGKGRRPRVLTQQKPQAAGSRRAPVGQSFGLPVASSNQPHSPYDSPSINRES